MLCLRNFALMAFLLCGIACESRCHAQVECLEYPIYYDGAGTYLFVAEQNDGDPVNCSDQGEVYVWVTSDQLNALTPSQATPEACGNPAGACTQQFARTEIFSCQRRGRRRGYTSSWIITDQLAMKGKLPSKDFMLGDNEPGAVHTIPNPKHGIGVTGSGIIWVYANNGSTLIPIKVFNATLDYKKAGVAHGKYPKYPPVQSNSTPTEVRQLLIGIEVSPNGVTPPDSTTTLYTPTAYKPSSKFPNNSYLGTIINVTDPAGGNPITVTIRTNTPLW